MTVTRPKYLDPPAPPGWGLWLEVGLALGARWLWGPRLWLDALVLTLASMLAASWGLWAGWALAGRLWGRRYRMLQDYVYGQIEHTEAVLGVRAIDALTPSDN